MGGLVSTNLFAVFINGLFKGIYGRTLSDILLMSHSIYNINESFPLI